MLLALGLALLGFGLLLVYSAYRNTSPIAALGGAFDHKATDTRRQGGAQ